MNRIEVFTLYSQLLEAKRELVEAQAAFDALDGKWKSILDGLFPLGGSK